MSRAQDEHNRGQKDGSQAGFLDELVENFNPLTSPEYKAGFHHGVLNKPQEGDDKDHDTEKDNSSSGGCLVSTACVRGLHLPNDCHELQALRALRDIVVARRSDGPALLAEYLSVAPRIVAWLDRRPDASRCYRVIYEYMVAPVVRLIDRRSYEAALALYQRRITDIRRAVDDQQAQ